MMMMMFMILMLENCLRVNITQTQAGIYHRGLRCRHDRKCCVPVSENIWFNMVPNV